MSASGDRSVVISAANSFMAASQQLVRDPMPPAPTPGPPPPPPLSLFQRIAGSYCGEPNYHWGYTANNITLEQCAAKCVELGCNAFDFDPGWPRPQPYCDNCRVLPAGQVAKPKASGQNYSCYTRAAGPAPPSPPGRLSYGLAGLIEKVPPGFSIETIMVLGTGPNAAIRKWGRLLTSRYNKSVDEDADFTTTHLGYDTDNGAYYYYNPEAGKTYAQTLLDVHAYAKKVGIPYRHVQLDSWWYIKVTKHSCCACASHAFAVMFIMLWSTLLCVSVADIVRHIHAS